MTSSEKFGGKQEFWGVLTPVPLLAPPVLIIFGINQIRRSSVNTKCSLKPWNAIVGLENPGQMRSPRETNVSTRRSAFHASVASFFV